MLRSLDSGVSAMEQFQQQMDVIGNNLANVNTTGFKGARVDFADALSQTLQGPGPGGSIQVGTGLSTSAIANQFEQGAITQTGGPNDLAISGNGFFEVKDPVTGATYVTRAGDFNVDTNGYLVTSTGMRVQGYSDTGLSTIGDIKLDNNGSTSPLASYSFSPNGQISVLLQDGTQMVRGQVLLQNFTSPTSLIKEGNNLYSGMSAAGPMGTLSATGTNGNGTLVTRSLEMSNVDLAGEFSEMITSQRAFQASARVITTSDEILQELVNLKH
jgi:flagellar hook protein FlgE